MTFAIILLKISKKSGWLINNSKIKYISQKENFLKIKKENRNCTNKCHHYILNHFDKNYSTIKFIFWPGLVSTLCV